VFSQTLSKSGERGSAHREQPQPAGTGKERLGWYLIALSLCSIAGVLAAAAAVSAANWAADIVTLAYAEGRWSKVRGEYIARGDETECIIHLGWVVKDIGEKFPNQRSLAE